MGLFNDIALAMKLNRETIGLTQSARIIGSEKVLLQLIAEGKIRAAKASDAPNAKLYCNMFDVCRYATTNHRSRK